MLPEAKVPDMKVKPVIVTLPVIAKLSKGDCPRVPQTFDPREGIAQQHRVDQNVYLRSIDNRPLLCHLFELRPLEVIGRPESIRNACLQIPATLDLLRCLGRTHFFAGRMADREENDAVTHAPPMYLAVEGSVQIADLREFLSDYICAKLSWPAM